MPVLDPNTICTALPLRGRLLGLDVGSKTVGLALSDPGWMIATPYATLTHVKFTATATQLSEIIAKENIVGLVVGLPISMDGSTSKQTQRVRQFAHNLLKTHDLPLFFWDERLSTAAVDRLMVEEMDLSRARRKELVDKLAAGYILQGFLDGIGFA